MTQIEIASPACLTLAAARFDGRPTQLGVALRHPPVHLLARPSAQLLVSGARADLAYYQAEHILKAFSGSPPLAPGGREAGGEGAAEIEIELAIPSHMGLGSAPIMGLSAARAIAMLHGLPADNATALAIAAGVDPGEGLPIQAFAQGGLLLVDEAGAALRRHVLPNDNEARDWAFVLVLPHPPAGAPEHLEASARRDLWQAAAHLDDRAEALLRGRLWPAAEGDDIAAFASALTELRALSLAPPPSPAEQAIFTIMAAEGALAWGCAATGLGIYGLVRGGEASRQLRRALSEHLGHTGGTVMATICEPSGARVAGA